MINISIDPPDVKNIVKSATRYHQQENYNEVETVYELVSENLFDEHVPESDDEEIEKNIHAEELFCSHPDMYVIGIKAYAVKHQAFYKESSSINHQGPNAPPPKQALV